MVQDSIMQFDPVTREEKPFPSHAMQYRQYHGNFTWNYNPWTGSLRFQTDIVNDPCGLNIIARTFNKRVPTWYTELQDAP